jgi:hypothetical protein
MGRETKKNYMHMNFVKEKTEKDIVDNHKKFLVDEYSTRVTSENRHGDAYMAR